ncbi:hypothetical protein Tco_0896563 [Tanacetum coccineum]
MAHATRLTATTSNRDDGGVNERLRSVEDSLANITRTIQEMMVMNHGLNGNGSDMRVLKKDKVNYGSGINGRNNADKIDAQNMFDGMSLNKFLTKHGTVKEYFDSFNSWFSWMTLEEWYRVNLFICGLPLEFGNGSKDSKEVVKNNMRLRDFDDSSKEGVKGKEKYSNGLIFDEQEVRIEAKLKVIALDNNNKCLVICGIFDKEDGEIKENTKSASFRNMVPASGKIIDGPKENELDKSNMSPLVDEQKESSVRGYKMFPNEVCRQKGVYTFGKCHDMWNEQVLASTKPESSVNESFESDMGADKSKHDMKTKGWEDAEFDADEFEYKIFKVVAYASDVHIHFDKTFTCDDQWWKFDIWKWPKRKRKGVECHNCCAETKRCFQLVSLFIRVDIHQLVNLVTIMDDKLCTNWLKGTHTSNLQELKVQKKGRILKIKCVWLVIFLNSRSDVVLELENTLAQEHGILKSLFKTFRKTFTFTYEDEVFGRRWSVWLKISTNIEGVCFNCMRKRISRGC